MEYTFDYYKNLFFKNYAKDLEDYILSCDFVQECEPDTYPIIGNVFKLNLLTGENSYISLSHTKDFYNKSYQTIKVNIMGNKKEFPLDVDLKDLQKALMVDQYIVEKLKNIGKLSKVKILNSPLLPIKRKIESALASMRKGNRKDLGFNIEDVLPKGLFEKISDRCKLIKTKQDLINENKIPPETSYRKYPKDPETFFKNISRIQNNYEKIKNAKVKFNQTFKASIKLTKKLKNKAQIYKNNYEKLKTAQLEQNKINNKNYLESKIFNF